MNVGWWRVRKIMGVEIVCLTHSFYYCWLLQCTRYLVISSGDNKSKPLEHAFTVFSISMVHLNSVTGVIQLPRAKRRLLGDIPTVGIWRTTDNFVRTIILVFFCCCNPSAKFMFVNCVISIVGRRTSHRSGLHRSKQWWRAPAFNYLLNDNFIDVSRHDEK